MNKLPSKRCETELQERRRQGREAKRSEKESVEECFIRRIVKEME